MAFLATALSAIGGTLGAATAGGFFSTVAGPLLASVALSALSRALAPRPRQPGLRSDQTLTGDLAPLGFTLGAMAITGSHVCPPLSQGDVGKTPNAYLTYVVALSDMICKGLDGIIISGESAPIGAGTHADYGSEIGGAFQDRAWVRFHDGSQTAADAMLLDKFGSDPDFPWSADMVLTGVAYAVVTFRYDREVFNALPELRFIPRAVELYDPRKDGTAGGSGTHRWNDTSTWEETHNPAVMIYNILRGIPLAPGVTWGGEATAAQLPASDWFAAMNVCDQAVTISGGGTEPRYRAGIEVQVTDEPGEVIEQLLKACAGEIVDMGGTWRIRCGGPGLPVMFISDDDILVSRPEDFDAFPPADQIYNAISAVYPAPAQYYEARETPLRVNATWEAEDGDRRLPVTLDLPAVPYWRQAQRLARALIRDHRRMRRHGVWLDQRGLRLEPLDTIGWTSTRNGYVAKAFEVTATTDVVQDCRINLALRETDPTDYDWGEADELPDPPAPVIRTRPAAQAVPGFGVSPASVLDATGTARRPGIAVVWDGDGLDDVTAVKFQVRRAVASVAELREETRDVEDGEHTITKGILPATNYYVRARLAVRGRKTAWTSWVFVTTPAVYIQSVDYGPTGIEGWLKANSIAPVKAVTSLPATGALGDIVNFGGKIYHWTGSAWSAAIPTTDLTGTLDIARFAAGIRPVEVVNSLPGAGNFDGRQAYLTTDKKLYRHNGTAWTSAVPAVDVTGQLTDAQIAAVAAAKLTGQITSPQVADGAITDAKIAAVAAAKLTGQITSTQITNDAITTPKLAAGAVTANEIAANAITTGKIAAGAVTADEIAANAVTAESIAAGAITAVKVAAGAIETAKLAAGAVTANEIAANAVTAAKIAASAVTTAKLAAGAVTANEIAANAITTGKIAAGAIGANQLAANALRAKHVVIGDFENLVRNGDFADGTSPVSDYWTAPVGGTFSYLERATNAAWALTGARSISLGKPAGDLTLSVASVTTTRFEVASGDVLYVDTAIRGFDGVASAAGAYLRIEWFDAAGTYTFGNHLDLIANAPITGSWVRYTKQVTVPSYAVTARMRIVNHSSNTTTRLLLFDRIIVRRANAGELIVDGTLTADKVNTTNFGAAGLAVFGGTLVSDNYVSGTSGWRITKSGVIEADSLLVRRGMIDLDARSRQVGYVASSVSITSTVATIGDQLDDLDFVLEDKVGLTKGTRYNNPIRISISGALYTTDATAVARLMLLPQFWSTLSSSWVGSVEYPVRITEIGVAYRSMFTVNAIWGFGDGENLTKFRLRARSENASPFNGKTLTIADLSVHVHQDNLTWDL